LPAARGSIRYTRCINCSERQGARREFPESLVAGIKNSKRAAFLLDAAEQGLAVVDGERATNILRDFWCRSRHFVAASFCFSQNSQR
jgi:hypothetical protein